MGLLFLNHGLRLILIWAPMHHHFQNWLLNLESAGLDILRWLEILFAGGGSIPFEAARLGCETYGSDLNPIAALLTWAGLNIIGGGMDAAKRAHEAQSEVLNAVDQQISEWGIEQREPGLKDLADAGGQMLIFIVLKQNVQNVDGMCL